MLGEKRDRVGVVVDGYFVPERTALQALENVEAVAGGALAGGRLAVEPGGEREQAEIGRWNSGAGDRAGEVVMDAAGARLLGDYAVEPPRRRGVRAPRRRHRQHLAGMH